VRNGRGDIVAGLAAGADDYVVKGASTEELLARIGVGRRITRLERSLRSSNRENRRMATTDPLTGVHNRRFLMKYLPRELERSRRSDQPMAVLSCDLDHFKDINDKFGHEAGDQALQGFVKGATACIREGNDWIVRSGGEEFVIVLPDTDLAGACCVAQRLRQVLASEQIPTSTGAVTLTVSTGASALETERDLSEASVLDLLRAADRGLYASKDAGRDRVTPMLVEGTRPGPVLLPRVPRGAS
jgi:two-component system cell cycle response regulator